MFMFAIKNLARKGLTEPMLAKICDAIWHHQATVS